MSEATHQPESWATVLSPEEIGRREPVWQALSELFVDTELDENDLRSIARTLRSSGHSNNQLDAILRDEVLPVFFPNLSSVTGNWTGWDRGTVRDFVLAQLSRDARSPRSLVPKRWWRAWKMRTVKDGWIGIQALLARSDDALEPIPAPESSPN